MISCWRNASKVVHSASRIGTCQLVAIGQVLVDPECFASNMAEGDHLGASDLGNSSHWAQLAGEHWPKATKSKKVKPEIVKKEIWDVLEQEAFHFRSLLTLENLQLLEKYTPLSNPTNIY